MTALPFQNCLPRYSGTRAWHPQHPQGQAWPGAPAGDPQPGLLVVEQLDVDIIVHRRRCAGSTTKRRRFSALAARRRPSTWRPKGMTLSIAPRLTRHGEHYNVAPLSRWPVIGHQHEDISPTTASSSAAAAVEVEVEAGGACHRRAPGADSGSACARWPSCSASSSAKCPPAPLVAGRRLQRLGAPQIKRMLAGLACTSTA